MLGKQNTEFEIRIYRRGTKRRENTEREEIIPGSRPPEVDWVWVVSKRAQKFPFLALSPFVVLCLVKSVIV